MINEALLKNEEQAVYRLRSLYSGMGYMQYKMSKFEEYDLYVKNKDFLISDRVITFTDTNGKLLALKPDVTLSIINNLGKSIDGIHKMYYNENVYRVSGATGKFKEIMQTGLECIGATGVYETAEVLYLALKSLEAIDGNFRLEISHASLLEELVKDNFSDENVIPDVLEAIKIKNSGMISALLDNGRITENQAKLINALCCVYSEFSDFTAAIADYVKTDGCKKISDEFSSIVSGVSNDGTRGKITVNFALSSEAGYYSGIVFKGYINGIPTSVLSGGQYDKLMRKLGNSGGAVGFAVYLDSFERFGGKTNEYDVDTVLLIDENASPEKVLAAAEEIRGEGKTVSVMKKLPSDLRYREIVKMEGAK